MQTIKNRIRTVLVSGGGGDIGIAIGRILKEYGISSVLGCDIKREHAGECVFDTFLKAPFAHDERYIEFLSQVFKDYQVDLFIPTSEAEITAVLEYGVEGGKLLGVDVLMTNHETINLALDKYKTARSLEKIRVNAPWTEKALQMPKELPCIFKPRSGQGSKGLKIVTSLSESKALLGSDKYIWQELLLPDEQEYTCGIFRHSNGVLRSIVMKRTLSGGFTNTGEVVDNNEISAYISEIVNKLGIYGAVNFQLRLTNKGPVLFEINPRLSSTVMFRHKLGFEDLIWAIEDRLNLPLRDYNPPKAGTKFYRGIQEYIK